MNFRIPLFYSEIYCVPVTAAEIQRTRSVSLFNYDRQVYTYIDTYIYIDTLNRHNHIALDVALDIIELDAFEYRKRQILRDKRYRQRRQFLRRANSIVRFKSLIIRLIYRRL